MPNPTTPRSLQALRFLGGFAWFLIAIVLSAHAAPGITTRLNLPSCEPLLEQAFLLFLLIVGFSLPYGINRPGIIRRVNALPERSTGREELLRGAALGWAMLLVAVLPMMLTGALHPQFSFSLQTLGQTLLSVLTIALATLALEIAFRGHLFMRLISVLGPVGATTLLSFLYALLSTFRPNATPLSFVITFFTGILFSIAYLRTHALWLGWGIHFGWNAAMAILFGLPIAGNADSISLISTDVSGHTWLTGGPYGPEAAAFTALVLLAAIPVLYRISRDYEWAYTHPPIIAAGYEVTIAPPAAHSAMETAAAAAPTPLIQILGSTPTAASTLPAIDDHLRNDHTP